MQRERALFVARPESLTYMTADYQRLYYGDEFCERLLPSPAELKEAQTAAGSAAAFTLVTPYVTPQGLTALVRLLEMLPEGTEVVFNDWGVLRVLGRDFPHLVPVLGRLLTKIKRGPRIVHFLDSLPREAAEHFRKTNLGVPAYARFLQEHHIRRVDLDNPLQGLDLHDVPEQFSLSLYIPFVYVTTTRFCLVANCDVPEKKGFIGVFPCGRECRRYTFYLDNKVMTTLLIRRGNAVFYKTISTMNERIREGQTIAEQLDKHRNLFPSLVIHMVSVGEKSAYLEDMLLSIADAYDNEVEITINTLTSLLEPVMILVMAVVVGFIYLAILLPILEMGQIIH